MTSRTSYKKKKYSGPKASRKKRMAALKQFHGEGVCLADIYRLKNAGQLSFMKCVKCGSTNETDPTLNFYKFPYPNVNEKRRTAARAWAEYCWPDKVLTPEELTTVYKEKQMVCSKHFPDKETVRQYGLNTEIPIDLAAVGCERNKRKIVRKYRRKGAVGENTISNTSARQEQPKHNFLKASSDTELNFMEGENAAELFAKTFPV